MHDRKFGAFRGKRRKIALHAVDKSEDVAGGIPMSERRGEIIANVERLHESMDRYNCSAIVVRSGKNFTYEGI
jgi:hypothetical protein